MVEWTAVILAGGIGSRLWPITANRPKPLVSVVGKPMIIYAIDLLRYAGVHNIIVVVRHMGEQIRRFLADKDFEVNVQIPYVDSLDTADALRKVGHLIDTEYIIVSMADIITNIHLKEFLKYSIEKDGIGAISTTPIDTPSQFGVVVVNEKNRIQSFLEKPDSFELYISSMLTTQDIYLERNVVNTGIYAFQREILEILDRTRLMDFGKEVFPFLLENNYPLYGYIANYYWQDAGNPQFYKYVNWDLLRKWAWPIVPPGKEIREYVWIEAEAVVPDLEAIDQHVAIGKRTRLGTNVRIQTLSALGNDVAIGDNTIVQKSVIWDHVRIGANCQILESVICEGVEIENDVIIEPNCVVGSNSNLKAGVKVRSGSHFPPNSIIENE